MKAGYLFVLGAAVAFSSTARADMSTYYVGLDTAAGTNQGHLTFLRAHGDHFHRLGVFGGLEGRIPESYIGGELLLSQGTGQFAGRYVSGEYQIEGDLPSEYSDLEIRPISTLAGFADGTPEATLLSGGLRYLGSLGGASLALELVSISSGLHVADQAGNEILSSAGDRHVLGAAGSFAAFTPLFFTDPASAPGASYSATFRLVDVNGIVPQSGTFRYEFRSVLEPASLATMGLGLGTLGLIASGRRKGQSSPVVVG